MDTARLRESFARVAAHGGDAVAHHFYSDLFLRHPGLRRIFPMSMDEQREHLIGGIARIVAEADRADELGPFLAHQGRIHYDRDVTAEMFPPVRVSFLATLEHYLGAQAWAEVAADWAGAFDLIAGHMTAAADEAARHSPARWDGTVLAREQRGWDISVLHVAASPDGPPLEYLPGQSCQLETLDPPRLRQWYSPATPPPPDGVLEFHVLRRHGGRVSPVLTGLQPGDGLLIRRPGGAMTFDPSGRPVIMAAWSTGWAPLKAILLQVAGMPAPPQVHLFIGARRPDGLYDMPAVKQITEDRPWLTVTPVVTAGPSPGETGPMAEVIARRGNWPDGDAYLAGPGRWMLETAACLTAGGMPPERVRTEDFGWKGPR